MEEVNYTAKEIASIENVSVDTVYRWCAEGFIIFSRRPSLKGKGCIVIREDDYKTFKELFGGTEI